MRTGDIKHGMVLYEARFFEPSTQPYICTELEPFSMEVARFRVVSAGRRFFTHNGCTFVFDAQYQDDEAMAPFIKDCFPTRGAAVEHIKRLCKQYDIPFLLKTSTLHGEAYRLATVELAKAKPHIQKLIANWEQVSGVLENKLLAKV